MIVAREKAEYYGIPQLPQEKRRPARRPVQHTMVRRDRLALTGLVLLCFGCCVIIAYYYAQVLAIGYQINKTEKELAALRVESYALYTDVNELASLENIESVAIHRLGMVKPQNDRVVLVEKVEPPRQGAAAAGDAGQTAGAEQTRETQSRRGQNWVIEAFAKMVGRLEASINAG